MKLKPEEYFTRAACRKTPVSGGTRGTGEAEIFDFLGGEDHYSGSFGKQWVRYRDVQIDRLNGTAATLSHLRDDFAQGDLSVFEGARCLEIGSGAGRFTDYLVDLCEEVITIEPSAALAANAALGAPNLIGAHADLFDVPIRRELIDVVFCRGVTQHTADPRRAIRRLFDYVRPGGWVLFDVYPLRWYTPFVTKYWIRPLTRGMDPMRFMAWAETWVPRLLKIKAVVNAILPDGKLGRNLANQLVPVADFTRAEALRDPEQRVMWSILDTVDMYTPRYDTPLTFAAILREIRRLGASDVRANKSTFCFRARAPRNR